jgi:AcrR family transcriptional regulator
VSGAEVSARDVTTGHDVTDPRGRLVRTTYDLLRHHSIGGVGVDRIVREAGVAKMTLYRHFSSKQELVLSALELREQLCNCLLEVRTRRDPIGSLCAQQLMNAREMLRSIAARTDSREPDRLAHGQQVLMWGSILGAGRGDQDAAVRAKEQAMLLLADHGLV